MKNTFIAALLLLCACKEGLVTVQRAQDGILAPAPASAPSTAPQIKSPGEEPVPTLYFARVFMDNGAPSRLTGISFLSAVSEVTHAFSVDFSRAMGFLRGNSVVFSPFGAGVAYMRSFETDQSTLAFSDVETMATTTLSANNPREIVTSSDGTRVAWIDDRGVLLEATRGIGQKPYAVELGGAWARHLILGSDDNSLWVTLAWGQGGVETAVLPFGQGLKGALSRVRGSVTSVSPDGQHFVVSDLSRTYAYVTDGTGKSSQPVESRYWIADSVWLDNSRLAYIAIGASGIRELRSWNIVTGAREFVAQQSKQASFEIKGSCLASFQGDLYFADYQDYKDAIYRAHNDKGQWNTRLFADPPDRDTGYVCPRLGIRFNGAASRGNS